ncbi:hypothetical protein HPB50_027372 [Hyalomma asiaticum]|uniref:Uncharacterized protein n=1 Tax=Hyalomma asiaticum TaxID=266040 RepID=A0ACB7TV64_HYAAI|nr:hypothetical protein HPB50_027372 [Hyalomma asiaticum]
MSTLARKLDSLTKLGSAVYADDITLWLPRGSTREKKQLLQNAVEVVQHHIARMNLQLSSGKSELLAYRPIRITDGTNWLPSKNSKICSQHFVGNCKSDEDAHPAYNPSIFPASYKNRVAGGSFERYERLKSRNNRRAHELKQNTPTCAIDGADFTTEDAVGTNDAVAVMDTNDDAVEERHLIEGIPSSRTKSVQTVHRFSKASRIWYQEAS